MIEELSKIDTIIFGTLKLNMIELSIEKECLDYSGYNFKVKNFKMKFRKAKITPKKVGQFVTLWEKKCTKPDRTI